MGTETILSTENQYYLSSCKEQNEIERLETQHKVWLLLLNGSLCKAPIEQVNRHLDIGCGSGIWTTAFAKAHPTTAVDAIDLTPPVTGKKPSNLNFIEADGEKEWQFAKGATYDFITARVLVASIKDWPALLQRCLDHLNPGGWVEIADATMGTFSDNTDWRDESCPIMQWNQCLRRGSSSQGINGWANQIHGQRLKEAGFVNVEEHWYHCYMSEKVATTPKEKEIAGLMLKNAIGLLDAGTKMMVNKADSQPIGLNASQLLELQHKSEMDLVANATERRYYWPYSIHIGQKPPL